jgi:hypothetical protein
MAFLKNEKVLVKNILREKKFLKPGFWPFSCMRGLKTPRSYFFKHLASVLCFYGTAYLQALFGL